MNDSQFFAVFGSGGSSGGGGGGTFYFSVPFTIFNTARLGGTLVSGAMYLITDYQTIYPQPDYIDEYTPKNEVDWTIKFGDIEPIVVIATSNNSVSNIAYSTVFVNDYIEYDCTEETYNTITTKGKITRRKDNFNNDVPFDFRNVLFKRYYNTTNAEYDVIWDNGEATQEDYVFNLYDPLLPLDYTNSFQNNVINVSLNNDEEITDTSVFNIWAFNTIIKNLGTNNKIFGTVNNCILQDAYNNNFSGIIYNINFPFCYRNNISGKMYNNIFSGEFNNNTVSGGINNSNFVDFKNNKVFGFLSTVDASDTLIFSENTINNNISLTTWNGGSYVRENEFNGNDIGSCLFGTPFSKNQFNRGWLGTICGNFFTENTINGVWNSCLISDNFSQNTLNLNIPSVDFSLATHVYGDYFCELFRREDGAERLRYTNNTDAIVVTDINS